MADPNSRHENNHNLISTTPLSPPGSNKTPLLTTPTSANAHSPTSTNAPPLTPPTSTNTPPLTPLTSTNTPPLTPLTSTHKPPLTPPTSTNTPPLTPLTSTHKPSLTPPISNNTLPLTPPTSNNTLPLTPLTSAHKSPLIPPTSNNTPSLTPPTSNIPSLTPSTPTNTPPPVTPSHPTSILQMSSLLRDAHDDVATPRPHSCGSLFGQCTPVDHVEPRQQVTLYEQPVSLTEVRSQRELHRPILDISAEEQDDDRWIVKDIGREHLIVHDGLLEHQRVGNGSEDEVLLREYYNQQLRFLGAMGAGASKNKVGDKNAAKAQLEELEYLRGAVPQLKQEVKEWEDKACSWEVQLVELRGELEGKEEEVTRLQQEVHKLKSVLQQATSFAPDGDLLGMLQEQQNLAGQQAQVKKQGVSGESTEAKKDDDIIIAKHDKDFRSKQLIKEAIMDNDFLKNLDSSQIRELVESMYPKDYALGSYVINEGEAGSHLYVAAEGAFEVIKEKKVLGRMGPGKAFGELAILYNCTRTASIRVTTDAKVWVLDRRVFQQIMMRTGLQRLEDNVNFLRSVPLLKDLNAEVLAKIADVLEVEFYPAGAYIVRQGAAGDIFFIISGGTVKVTQRLPGRRDDEDVRFLERGEYFGEQALLNEECRTANIIAMQPGVECLTLDRESFIQLIGNLHELQDKDYGDETRGLTRPLSSLSADTAMQEFSNIHLDDLDIVATLGVGGFGRVELVQSAYDKSRSFALKCLKKKHVIDTQQQEHVFSEKNIMFACRSPFICRLYRTFRDAKYVYMLLEACLGGEVWTILRDRGNFEDGTTRFLVACVIEAFDYLHARGVIYRDLKPENLLLDSKGYVKIVDFGFSKRLGYSAKTWTFCGTPEYVAPEIILNKGHDRAVDYWSLGVLMHELLTGTPPFTAADPMKTYNVILKGIDQINFPKHMTKPAQSLIKRLCRDLPPERLGYQKGGIQDIKKHKWFQGFDWEGLRHRALVGPIVQQVRGPTDTSNFDTYPKDNDNVPDENSGWDVDF